MRAGSVLEEGGGVAMMSSGIHSGRGPVVAGMVLPLGFGEGKGDKYVEDSGR